MRSYLAKCIHLPLCLLLDLTLGDADGLELCAEVKASPALQRMPVVVLSGRALSSEECLRHQAVYHVRKGPGAETELPAALKSVITQQERSHGVVDAGTLRLDPRGHFIFLDNKPTAILLPGPFSAFLALVQYSPKAVSEESLYGFFLERAPHDKPDEELSVHLTVRTYISRLRRSLGEELGSRITFVHGEGYVYRAPAS